MTPPVSYETVDDIAVITISNPPANALGYAVRQGLWDAFERFAQDRDARAALLLGEGKLFLGGADISEFGKPLRAPLLPAVINRIEDSLKPVVCAIQGVALGGGLEVALGCHYRLAIGDAVVGLPEVTLGVIPGAGGTQRLPRLAGLHAALELVPAGARIPVAQALELGIVDDQSHEDPREAGLAFVRALLAKGAGPRPVGAMPCPVPDAEALTKARAQWKRKAPGEVARLAALDAVEASTRLAIHDGLAEERRIFLEMMETPQRAGLIHAFFSERRTAKLPELKGVAPRDFSQIGVIGGGTMGSGIATAALLSGLHVVLVEQNPQAAQAALARIEANLHGAVQRGKLSGAARDSLLASALQVASDLQALARCDIAIEAVFEDQAVKTELLAKLDQVMKPGAVLATNTSYLDVAALAGATQRPADVIGLHFFSPAHVMKLLEVVVPEGTAPDVVATGFALAKRLGKIAVRAGVCDGFIGNRIMTAYRACADRMVLGGTSPYDIDRALRAFGWPMGPFEMGDMAGLDIGYAARARRAATRDPADIVPTWADRLHDLRRHGRKSGRGYYIYDDGAKQGREDPEVLALIDAARQDSAYPQSQLDAAQIQRRYMAALVNEAARVLEDGIAQRPLDVDVTFLYGYGFPRWRGGPLHWADAEGLPKLLADIESWAQQDAFFWQPAPLLQRLVSQGGSFASLNT